MNKVEYENQARSLALLRYAVKKTDISTSRMGRWLPCQCGNSKDRQLLKFPVQYPGMSDRNLPKLLHMDTNISSNLKHRITVVQKFC